MTKQQPAFAPWVVGIAIATFLSINQNAWEVFGSRSNTVQTGSSNAAQFDDRNLQSFAPPNLYQEIGGTQSVVTLVNASPDALKITLQSDSGERLQLDLPACQDCQTYDRNNLPECGSIGVKKSFQVPPGYHEAKGFFIGLERTKGFRSDWQLTPGWEHQQCIYTLNEVQLY